MKNKKYDTILFDMDGTLIDSDPMIKESFKQLCDLYRNGRYCTPEELAAISGPPIRVTLAKEFPDKDTQFMYDEFHRICLPLYKTHVFSYPHSHEVLERLKNQGFKLGIVTNKQHELTELALKYLSLDKYFEVIIGLNDLTKGKPDPEGIHTATKMLGGKKPLYIGDNKSDFETCVNGNIDCCLVKWGPRVLPSDIKPAFFISSYLELEGHLYE